LADHKDFLSRRIRKDVIFYLRMSEMLDVSTIKRKESEMAAKKKAKKAAPKKKPAAKKTAAKKPAAKKKPAKKKK
jgi:hypothetical protein